MQLEILTLVSQAEAETYYFGQVLGSLLKAGQLIALIGELGTGKTRWAQGIGQGLSVPADETINSPTFTFINHYSGRLPFYHADVYRLTSVEEAETLGLEDYFSSDGVCLIEWADQIQSILPEERLEISLEYIDETKRKILMQAHGTSYQSLLATFKNQITEEMP